MPHLGELENWSPESSLEQGATKHAFVYTEKVVTAYLGASAAWSPHDQGRNDPHSSPWWIVLFKRHPPRNTLQSWKPPSRRPADESSDKGLTDDASGYLGGRLGKILFCVLI